MKRLSFFIVMSFLMMASCSRNDDTLNSSEVEVISSELLSEVCIAEAAEMSLVIFNSLSDSKLGSTFIPNATSFSAIDSLLAGTTISVAGTGGKNNPQGTIIIDFQTGTTRNGVTRKGIIKISYSGRRWALGSTRLISFSGYSKNNVTIGDSTNYTITNSTADSSATTRGFDHVLTSHTLTFPDHTTFYIKEAHFKDSTNFTAKTTTLLHSDLTNDVEGKTRYGVDFNVKITSPLVYKPQCIGSKMYLPNVGEKTITISGTSKYSITYGSTCSNIVGVSGSKSGRITINSDGN